MFNSPHSLNRLFPKQYFIPSFLLLSSILLVFGLFLPVITLKELILWKSTFSVLTGIWELFHERHYLLGVVILFFSFFFPIIKLSVLFYVWYWEVAEAKRNWIIEWLGVLGKWSMLDVFVVALTVIITQISTFAKAEARIGIYFFGVSIALAMIATEKIERLLKNQALTSVSL